nr:ABC transporter ATP-binding protein [Eubacterium oxidoreducens]
MLQLIGLVKPLIGIMILAVVLGVLGYLCAIFLTVISSGEVILLLAKAGVIATGGFWFSLKSGAVLLIIMAIARGIFHYGEQYCNHFIAFKLLAKIRHQVFETLRKLCPAKLEGREKGNLISLITSDVELLEVFYAHTISPIAIAIIVSLVMVVFLGHICLAAGWVALVSYLLIGLVLPIALGKTGASPGVEYRKEFGSLNSFVLDCLYGLDETIQYEGGVKRTREIISRSQSLGEKQKHLNHMESLQKGLTNLLVLVCSVAMLLLMTGQYRAGTAEASMVFMATIALMGSFGPVIALSNLSNNLNQTLACGQRILDLLKEEPLVEEVPGEKKVQFSDAKVENVTFSYEEEEILKNFSMQINGGSIVGIHGPSGCGKSTILKLLMRFWDVDRGRIFMGKDSIRHLPSKSLRGMESYVTQETFLFHDTIANNIGIGKLGATREEIIEAARAASLHDAIVSFPEGYDTMVGENGDTLSGGERQRIGIARAFLSDRDFLLLDEPTSNLDALNEGIILKSLKEHCLDKTILLVSHRRSTLQIADEVVEMNRGRGT